MSAPVNNPFESAPLREPRVFRTRAQREAHHASEDAATNPYSPYNAQRRRLAYQEWSSLRTAERRAQRKADPDIELPSLSPREQVEDYCRFLAVRGIPRNPYLPKRRD